MRRYLFAVIASLTLVAALPAVSVARSHDHRDKRERHHRHHDRIRHFRSHDKVQPSGPMAVQDAGTVQSFTSDVLTIKLTDGTMVSGRVNRFTEIECQAMDQDFVRDDGGPGPGPSGNGGGDNGDRGDQGDDRGDRGDQGDQGDQGDDNGNDNQNCLTALQTQGTKVRDATLKLTGAGAIWDRVDLDA